MAKVGTQLSIYLFINWSFIYFFVVFWIACKNHQGNLWRCMSWDNQQGEREMECKVGVFLNIAIPPPGHKGLVFMITARGHAMPAGASWGRRPPPPPPGPPSENNSLVIYIEDWEIDRYLNGAWPPHQTPPNPLNSSITSAPDTPPG